MTPRLNGRISERALRTALGMQAQAVATATHALAASFAASATAAHQERAAIGAIGQQAEAASSLAADDLAVEAFAAWLPTGRLAVAAARARRDQVEADVAVARATLATARSAEAAIEALLAQHAQMRAARLGRKEQAATDETASRLSLLPRSGRD